VFVEDEQTAFAHLQARFPSARYQQAIDKFQEDALIIFRKDWSQLSEIKLHLAGSAFQLKVWESLLKIPQGSLVTYGDIAREINSPSAARAVGTAIGSTPIAYLIPCHRVIQNTGRLGGYMWGPSRKAAIIGWEAALTTSVAHSVYES